MTVALLSLAAGAGMIWAAWRCYKLLPLFAGRVEPGTHCTGSLITLIAGYAAFKTAGSVGSGITSGISSAVSKLLAGLFGAAGGAIVSRRRKRRGQIQPTPTPTPSPGPELPGPGGGELPSPSPPQLPGPGEAAFLTATPISATQFSTLTGITA